MLRFLYYLRICFRPEKKTLPESCQKRKWNRRSRKKEPTRWLFDSAESHIKSRARIFLCLLTLFAKKQKKVQISFSLQGKVIFPLVGPTKRTCVLLCNGIKANYVFSWCLMPVAALFFGVLLPVFCVWLIRISDMISIPLRKNLNYRQREKEEMCKLSIKLSGAIGCDTPTLQTSLRASQKLDKRERERLGHSHHCKRGREMCIATWKTA